MNDEEIPAFAGFCRYGQGRARRLKGSVNFLLERWIEKCEAGFSPMLEQGMGQPKAIRQSFGVLAVSAGISQGQ
ncbi:hypothetical protein EET67_10455 [Pseudaminobacter arsenicus]|uniref:Uncharacterized protein n=1 Tax=Borborobacter arsenicus TaxID=1851146 RepID=A0A432V7H0_9HYPH|nr:hypothetical protein [Pseudaminobacter arsenicus]RUM98023.1 hypothetical protein EET67_10455 [Pseudaminobacter arsenicus]